MYRKYYSYSDMPQLIKHEEPEKQLSEHREQPVPKQENSGKLFGRFENDDIILGVIILALLMDDSDDSLLLIALAFIFLTGIA